VIRRISAIAVALAMVVATMPASADEEPSAEAKAEAKLHFTAGVNLLRDPEKARYDEAYTEFKRAYELVKSPSILGNIALCALKLERDGEALEAYTRYLAEVPGLDAEERAQTERDIVTLKAQLVKVTLETKPDGALIHDARITGRGESVTNIYGPLRGPTELGLRRGHHIVKARFRSGREVGWELDVNGGESHVFDEPAAPVTPGGVGERSSPSITTRPVPSSVYIGATATGAFAVGTIVVGSLALGAASRYDDANDGTSSRRASDLRSEAQTLNVVSDVLLGGAIIGAAVTAYLYLTRPSVTTAPGSQLTGRAASSVWVTRF
jgi:hypothetical protein